jgi:CheY-like chemotaxis protein/HPt (histidine-containing phosphotransfer) domain-containing protein
LARSPLPPFHVLLVEDGETNRELISLVLAEAGASVVCAENGREGVELAGRETFDLILMDMQMPVMDGYTATQALRSLGIEIPIIALTAHAMRGDHEKCVAAGCSHYLSKPVQIDSLLESVRAAVADAEITPRLTSGAFNDSTLPFESSLPTELPRFRRIVDSFVSKLPQELDEIRSACSSGDWTRLERLAHKLKGSGGTVGFDCLTAPARELEQHARRGDAAEALRALGKLQTLVDRIAGVAV